MIETCLDEAFLLTSTTARNLYHDYAEHLPIIDYHCHLSPKEMYEDRRFENLTQLWLGGDHYKWRLLRANGVEEAYITGEASDREKFQKWAETLPLAIGNPLYHWSHLELRRYFGYKGVLNGDTAEQVWQLCNETLAEEGMSARGLMLQSHVELVCTTDDPIDSLEWHQRLQEDTDFSIRVLPTWRPDQILHIESEGYLPYLQKLEEASGVQIHNVQNLWEALDRRMDWFAKWGCCVADHGMEAMVFRPVSDTVLERIFQKRCSRWVLSEEEVMEYQTAVLLFLGRMYHQRNWVMQLHYGVQRNVNQSMHRALGADVGGDCIQNETPIKPLTQLLNALELRKRLPKTILYSLNPSDYTAIGTMMGCFQDQSARGKIQMGSAWWFNDHKQGMIAQLMTVAQQGLLGNFIGMLTDSRSFLSYTRHEYFRRILCELIGGWVENGEYPRDDEMLAVIIKGICHDNAVKYFGFEKEEGDERG